MRPFGVSVHTDRGWRAVVLVSPDRSPSALPGLVRLGIGNAFRSLHQVAVLTADARGGAGLAGILPLSMTPGVFHWQAITFDPANLRAPLEVSNVATGRIY